MRSWKRCGDVNLSNPVLRDQSIQKAKENLSSAATILSRANTDIGKHVLITHFAETSITCHHREIIAKGRKVTHQVPELPFRFAFRFRFLKDRQH
jgi:hypothetical protein